MWRWNLAILAVTVALTCCQATVRKATLGKSLKDVSTIAIGKGDSDGLITVSSIQKDEYRAHSLLVAAGSALYSVSTLSGRTTLVTGNLMATGYRNGIPSKALFNQINGFVQLDNGIVLISDTGNRCLRRLDRIKHKVEQYSGKCGQTKKLSYSNWEAFYSPRTLRYDRHRNTIYLLDGESTIWSRNLDDDSTKVVYGNGGHVNDFIHDTYTNTLALSDRIKGVFNISSTAQEQVDYSQFTVANSLTAYDGVLMISDQNSGTIKFIDVQQTDPQPLFTMCEDNPNNMLPDCRRQLLDISAIAAIEDYIYIGSQKSKDKLVISRVSISVHDSDTDIKASSTTTEDVPWLQRISTPRPFNPFETDLDVQIGSTTPSYLPLWNSRFPLPWYLGDTTTATTTTRDSYWWWRSTVHRYTWTAAPRYTWRTAPRYTWRYPTQAPIDPPPYSDGDDSGGYVGGGSLTGIIIGVVLAVILKITFWCCMAARASRRRRTLGVNQSRMITSAARRALLRTHAQRVNAYNRLQETTVTVETPAERVSFPSPPEYSSVVSSAENNSWNERLGNAPPAYTPSVPNSEPAVPLNPRAPSTSSAPVYTLSMPNTQPAFPLNPRAPGTNSTPAYTPSVPNVQPTAPFNPRTPGVDPVPTVKFHDNNDEPMLN